MFLFQTESPLTESEFSSLCFQLNLFLARLTGEPIGLTAMNLFVIDKPAILTVSTTIFMSLTHTGCKTRVRHTVKQP